MAEFPEIYEFGPDRLGIHLESILVDDSYSSNYQINQGYNRLDYFRQTIRAYEGLDENADKYVKKVKELIDKPMDEIELEQIWLAMAKVKCPRKLDISVSYQLTGRLPHDGLGYDGHYEKLLIHLYDTFCNESIKLLGKMVRCRTNVLYHLLDKVGKESNSDHFQFIKEPAHQRTEEEIKFIFDHLGWDCSPLYGAKGSSVPAPALASKVSLSSSTRNL